MTFVSLPSYPPRGQARDMGQERAPLQHLLLSHPSSSASSRDTNRSLRTRGTSSTPTVSSISSLSRDAPTSPQYPAHSEEQLFQLLEVAGIDAEVIADAVDHTNFESLGSWRLATACVAAALPLPDTGEVAHDAAMVDDNRALSPALLDIFADTGTGIHTSCESLLDTFGSCGSLMSLGSFTQPSAELMDLMPEDFAVMAAELVPDQPPATPLQTLAGCGSDLAQAVYEALTEVPISAAQLTSHPIPLFEDGSAPVCSMAVHLEEGPSEIADRRTDAPVPELSFGAGWVPCECSLPDLQDSPPAFTSSECSGESYPPLTAVSSDLSDARSAPVHPQQLSQQWPHATPLPQAADPAAVPNLAMDQQGATMAHAGGLSTRAGPGLAVHLSSGRRRRRRGRAGDAASSKLDAETQAQRNREHQKQYEARKRAREAVTYSLSESLQNQVESLRLDIEALCARQNKLLDAQAANHVSIVGLVSVMGLTSVDVSPSTMADSGTTYWTQFAADVDVTATQRRVLVQFLKDLVSELKALVAERKFFEDQIAQALKAADPRAIADNTLRIQCNHEVALELQARFTSASHKVLTEDQRKKLPGGGNTVSQPAQMQALCRALSVENGGAG